MPTRWKRQRVRGFAAAAARSGCPASVAAVLFLWLVSCAEQSPPPNIVLITLDTTRADGLGCYGYFRDVTPNLDRLAASSVRFDRAISHMGTTLPAHVSLLTSTHTTPSTWPTRRMPGSSRRLAC